MRPPKAYTVRDTIEVDRQMGIVVLTLKIEVSVKVLKDPEGTWVEDFKATLDGRPFDLTEREQATVEGDLVDKWMLDE